MGKDDVSTENLTPKKRMLSDIEGTETLFLERSEVSITVKKHFTLANVREIRMSVADPFDQGVAMLEKIIVDWDLWETEEKKAEVTIENLNKLDANDVLFLISKYTPSVE